MELICISHGVSNLIYRQSGSEQKLSRLGHAVLDQILMRPLPDPLFEQLKELIEVNIASVGNGLHGDIVHKVLLNI